MNTHLDFALATSAQIKADTTATEGIGEKIPITLYVWKGDILAAIVSPARSIAEDPQRRYEALVNAAFTLRRGFAVDGFTLACEGWRARERTETSPEQRFADGDPTVEECIAILHIEKTESSLLTIPFLYKIGRLVEFGVPNVEPAKEGAYVEVLIAALGVTPDFAPIGALPLVEYSISGDLS